MVDKSCSLPYGRRMALMTWGIAFHSYSYSSHMVHAFGKLVTVLSLRNMNKAYGATLELGVQNVRKYISPRTPSKRP
jgi:hypothetical protein